MERDKTQNKKFKPCTKCDGSGRIAAFGYYCEGVCFRCEGTGKIIDRIPLLAMERDTNKLPQTMELKFYVKEITWLMRLHGIDFGWGNGYVCLPEGHPCFGMDYDAIHDAYNIDVNGGLTFACHSDEIKKERVPELPEGTWWVVGFDTAHSWDTLERWPKESVELETKKLMEQLTNLQKISAE